MFSAGSPSTTAVATAPSRLAGLALVTNEAGRATLRSMPLPSLPPRPRLRRLLTALTALTALAGLGASGCLQREPSEQESLQATGNFATAPAGWYRGDFHFHTNYSDDAKRQGGDDLAQALRIADAYRDPIYLAAHPEHEGDGLDFINVTDHRTDLAIHDPDFQHPHLIVIPGEEYGGGGHATLIGLRQHIPHDPEPGETQDAHHRRAIAQAHAQGALFSPNHSCQPNRWPWTMDDIDALEVWNAPWTAFWPGTKPAELDAEVAANGAAENPYIRAAITEQGGGSNLQAMLLWYGLLSRGRHVVPIGGGDRHMVIGAGLPTTYVRKPSDSRFSDKSGKSLGWEGIVAGVREGGTFISRSPHGPQVELSATDAAGRVYPMGARLGRAGDYVIKARVGRAAGGLLRLVAGPLLPGSGPVAARPSIVHEVALTRVLEDVSFTWSAPAGGGWLHAYVLERRLRDDATPETLALAESFATLPVGDSLVGSLARLLPLVDTDILFDGARCTAASWRNGLAECMPADQTTGGSFYMPDEVERLINTFFEGGRVTPWSMGALTSAFLVPQSG